MNLFRTVVSGSRDPVSFVEFLKKYFSGTCKKYVLSNQSDSTVLNAKKSVP